MANIEPKVRARSIVNVDFQYAHRFMNWPGEAQYLHGHSGYLTLEIEDEVDEKSGFAYPCKEAYKLAWEIADNFHHGTLFQEGDPLLEMVLAGYEKAGIRNGAKGEGFHVPMPKALNHPLVKSYPECRVSVTKKVSTCENFCEIFYELLKDKLNIKKITFRSSLLNCASREF